MKNESCIMKNKKDKITFVELFESVRKPLSKPTRVHLKKKKKDKINDIKFKEQIDE